jgi:hypothetical protein
MGKPEGNKPLEMPRQRQEDNIKMDFREIGWDVTYWIDMARDTEQWRAVVKTVMNLRVILE